MVGCLALSTLVPLYVGATGNDETAWTGTVTAMNTDAHMVTAQTWWQTRRFYVGSDCAIATPDNPNATLKDLQGGQKIRVHYQKQGAMRIADRIEVEPRHVTGTVLAVDARNRMVTLDAKLQHRTFRLAKNCKVILWNNSTGTLADLAPGSRVRITYDVAGAPPRAYEIQEQAQLTASLR
jgi:hypothetical protein